MNIQELLNINDIEERDQQLRRSFNPYTPLIEVANHELTALCILLNLTQAKLEVEDLCDIEQAKAVLSNQMVIGKCLDNCQWFHTHNLKYPDPRVSRQRLIAPSPPIVGSVITSANCPMEFGWAFNASQIRYSQLFAASFLWNGAVVCLGQILIAGQSCWQELFVSLGISKNDLANICEKLTAAMPQSAFPDEVSPFSVQIRVPYQGKYCAVTPVVSHSLQCQLQRLIFDGKGRSTTIVHRNPPNISQLASALGGHVRVLKYLPAARYSSYRDFNQARIAKLIKNRSLFNKRAIKHKDFNDALRVGRSRYRGEKAE